MELWEYPDRFMEKVIINHRNGCWEFSPDAVGRYRGYWDGEKVVRAHRFSWCQANDVDEVPDGYVVCHTCDNTKCVNPEHLWLGTQKENMIDCSGKGRRSQNSRQKPGEDHSLVKLTEADVITIRRRYADGETCQSISVDYCVQSTQIHRIVTGKRWGHIKEGIQKSKPAAARVKPEDFYEIRRRRKDGEKLDDVAAAFGVSIATVSRIANGKVKDPEINQ